MTIKKKTAKVILLCTICLLVAVGLFTWVGNAGIRELPIANMNRQLRVVSMNVSADNVLSSDFQERLIKTQPDIIVIIEWTSNNLNLLKFKEAGYNVILDAPRKKVHGICILSKIDGSSKLIEAPIKTPCTLPIGQFRFKWHNHYVTLFAIHAPPPVPSCKGTTSEYLKAISSWVNDGKLSIDYGVGEQGDRLILAGDFNSLSMEHGIETLKSRKLNDNHSSFDIISPTWKPFKTVPYIAKIDYILCSDEFTYLSDCRFKIDNSDHLGIVADMEIK